MRSPPAGRAVERRDDPGVGSEDRPGDGVALQRALDGRGTARDELAIEAQHRVAVHVGARVDEGRTCDQMR